MDMYFTGRRYTVVWLHGQDQIDRWLAGLKLEGGAVGAGNGMVAAITGFAKLVKGSAGSPALLPISAVTALLAAGVAADTFLDVAAAEDCVRRMANYHADARTRTLAERKMGIVLSQRPAWLLNAVITPAGVAVLGLMAVVALSAWIWQRRQ